MAAGQDIRITDVPFTSTPDPSAMVYINDKGKLRQTDLTTIAKNSDLRTMILDAHETAMSEIQTQFNQSMSTLQGTENELSEALNTLHSSLKEDLNTKHAIQMSEMQQLIDDGHDKLLQDASAVDDLRVNVQGIGSTTSNAILNTYEGGLKLNHMSGNTEQKKLSGKNLVPMSWFDGMIANGSVNTYDGNTHTITLSGNAPSDAEGRYSSLHHIGEVGKIYTISVDIRGTAGKRVYFEMCNTRYEVVLSETYTRYSLPFVRTENTYLCFYTYATANGGLGAGEYMQFDNIQFELGETATPYEEFCGGMPSPNPSYPQPMLSTGDCVDMTQGTRLKSATITNDIYWVTTKNFIPCNSGNNVGLSYEKNVDTLRISFYDSSKTFISWEFVDNGNAVTCVAPTNAKYFVCEVADIKGITPQNAGKITITINGKYLGCAKTNKELFDGESESAVYNNATGVKVGDSGWCCAKNPIPCKKGESILVKHSFTVDLIRLFFYKTDGTFVKYKQVASEKVTEFSTVADDDGYFIWAILDSVVVSPSTLGELSITSSTNETIAWYTTQYPMIKGSTHFKENGLHKVEHKGSEYEINVDSIFPLSNGNQATIITPPYKADWGVYMCDRAVEVDASNAKNGTYYQNPANIVLIGSVDDTLETFKAKYDGTTILYTLATPIIETLDTESQIALNSLETFDGVTYVEFDTRVQPLEFEAEVGTSQVGAYTLKCMNDNDTDKVEREELKAQLNELAVALVAARSEG